jgi:UMF1 family MFS transporter
MKNTKNYPLNDKRTITGWAFFDWANSAYALTIAVAIFPNYYEEITDGQVYEIFGFDITNTALYSFALSFAYLLVSVLSPYLSGIADFGGKKLRFMKFFTYLGSVSCLMLFFFYSAEDVVWAISFFILATVGFAGGLVFYNSFLPDIVTEDQYDKVSAKGFAFGYFGSVLLLIINLVIIMIPDKFGLDPNGTLQYRIAFAMVGLWWFGFSFIPFSRLPQDKKGASPPNLFRQSMDKLQRVLKKVRQAPSIKRFLLAFFFYSAGVQTILLLATLFATSQLNFKTPDLIAVILLLQFLAIAGAYIFAIVSNKKGNKFALILMLFIWITICIIAYFVTTAMQFYAVAAGVGLVMGGIQSLSRSTYSKLLPRDTPDTTSYFSFYDVLEKYSVVIGTFIFGIIDQLFGMRNSVLALTVFFAIGIIALMTLKIKPALVED